MSGPIVWINAVFDRAVTDAEESRIRNVLDLMDVKCGEYTTYDKGFACGWVWFEAVPKLYEQILAAAPGISITGTEAWDECDEPGTITTFWGPKADEMELAHITGQLKELEAQRLHVLARIDEEERMRVTHWAEMPRGPSK